MTCLDGAGPAGWDQPPAPSEPGPTRWMTAPKVARGVRLAPPPLTLGGALLRGPRGDAGQDRAHPEVRQGHSRGDSDRERSKNRQRLHDGPPCLVSCSATGWEQEARQVARAQTARASRAYVARLPHRRGRGDAAALAKPYGPAPGLARKPSPRVARPALPWCRPHEAGPPRGALPRGRRVGTLRLPKASWSPCLRTSQGSLGRPRWTA